MTKDEARLARRARATFKRVLTNPTDPNAKIIGARRPNSAETFKAAALISRSRYAETRVRHAEEALQDLEPSLDRFK